MQKKKMKHLQDYIFYKLKYQMIRIILLNNLKMFFNI